MTSSRRGLLKAAAGLGIVACGAGVWQVVHEGVFAVGEGPAYAPWEDWRAGLNEGPLALVRAAILAASPHNTQPWRFRVEPGSIELHADPDRSLGDFDPFGRELHLGLGCALENMLRAAKTLGMAVTMELPPARLDAALPPGPAARLNLLQSAPEDDPLAGAIADRHTHRGPYDISRQLSPEILSELPAQAADLDGVQVVIFTDPEQRAAFGAEIVRATEAIIADEAMIAASDAWFRGSRSELQRNRDGTTLDAAGLAPWLAGLAKVLPSVSSRASHQHWLAATRDVQVPTATAFGLVVVEDLYDRVSCLQAGRAWERMQLWGASRGLVMQPLNQPLERVDRERRLGVEPDSARRLAGFTGDPALKPTFAFRAGYALQPANPSPRRPVEWVLSGA